MSRSPTYLCGVQEPGARGPRARGRRGWLPSAARRVRCRPTEHWTPLRDPDDDARPHPGSPEHGRLQPSPGHDGPARLVLQEKASDAPNGDPGRQCSVAGHLTLADPASPAALPARPRTPREPRNARLGGVTQVDRGLDGSWRADPRSERAHRRRFGGGPRLPNHLLPARKASRGLAPLGDPTAGPDRRPRGGCASPERLTLDRDRAARPGVPGPEPRSTHADRDPRAGLDRRAATRRTTKIARAVGPGDLYPRCDP